MKRLSVCMIVKDEEELIARCLESVQTIADEIIIVDTGSTDRTKDIVLQYSNQLYDYTWTDDFAAARNESLGYATGKWILVLDADEYLAKEELNTWIQFLDSEQPLEHIAYTLPIINFTSDSLSDDEITTSPVTRLFPNGKGIYFERPIHEQLTRGNGQDLFHKKIDLNIYHTGYQTKRVLEKNKHERNMYIFSQMKNNNEMSSYDWFTLGNQHRSVQEDQLALECYERAVQGTSAKVAWYVHCLVSLIVLYYKQNQLALSWKWTEIQLSKYKAYPEYYAIKGVHYETLGFFDEAIEYYKRAIELGETRASQSEEIWLVDPIYSFDMPVQQLIEIFFRMNRQEEAIYWLSKQLNKNKKSAKMLLRLVEWLSSNDSTQAIYQFLKQGYGAETDLADQLLLAKVILASGNNELIEAFCLDEKNNFWTSADLIRLSIIKQDKSGWDQQVQGLFKTSDDSVFYQWIQLAVGAVLWEDSKPLVALADHIMDERVRSVNELMISFLNKESLEEIEKKEAYNDEFFVIAKQLFQLQLYECFDSFIGYFKNAGLLNQLANYFYSINMIDLAMNYYSILLSQGELNFQSLENLGFYHLNTGYMEEAVEFFNEAVHLEPTARHVYRFLIENTNKEDKARYVEQFKKACPGYSKISFIEEFIRRQKK